jgi:hypothetical protein
MALIKCSECGKDVSSLANKCPNCGCPIVIPWSDDDTKSCLKGCVLMFISFIIFGIIVMVFLKLMGAL